MLSKVLVANRGEIAVRVIRTCTDLGIASVAVYSDVDENALHVKLADEAVRLAGGSPYLDGDRIVAAAVEHGADAIHPGYGFLAENADFAELVERAGLTFIGPASTVLRTVGDKVSARALARDAGVPVVPGIDDVFTDRLREFGDEHGWPLVIKAAAGGGGRGMRVLTANDDAADVLAAARAEAKSTFGVDSVYAERYLQRPRHVEVQVVADAHGQIVWCGDRDCSVQRRHQKLVEEAPAPGVDDLLRKEMADAAVRLARRVGYRGVGTVEFLVEGDTFAFLEMNPRIQVEHPVTELIAGIDLVREQLLIAGGSPTSVETALRGHAIECRINAEDTGRLRAFSVPWLPGVRVDTGYRVGDEIPPHYDSLVAKLVVWGPTREAALHRMRAALAEAQVSGVPTTIPAAAAVLSHPDFASGPVSTRWFEQVIEPSLHPGGAEGSGAWIAGRFHRIPSSAARRVVKTGAAERPAERASREVTSPMQGTVTAVTVAEGDVVSAGQVVATVEAMKMQHQLTAAIDGVVESVRAQPGRTVAAGELLVVVAPSPAPDGKDTTDVAL